MLAEYAKATGKTMEALKEDFSDSQRAYFTHRSKINKVLDMLWDNASVTSETAVVAAEAPSDEASAKKTVRKAAAKKTTAEKTVAEDTQADQTTKKTPAKAKKTKKATDTETDAEA